MKRIFVCLVVAALIPISGCAGEGSGGAENTQTSASSEWNPNSVMSIYFFDTDSRYFLDRESMPLFDN
ncbi:hypothetical protein ACRQF6_08640, partial [Actinotignum sp. GS-2025f]|uniref:hypothetical protein n=1 Tax=Actinotignum sp. GS-2025f TaxID=3427279 RepID=UPI003F45BF96